jgi:hypothetical protein
MDFAAMIEASCPAFSRSEWMHQAKKLLDAHGENKI